MPDPITRVHAADHRQDPDAYDTSRLPERTDLAPSGPAADARAIAALTTTPPIPLGLPPAGGRLDRVQEHTTALVETAKDWAELRIKLAQTEIEKQIQTKVNQIIMRAIPLIMIGVAGLFLLVTLAFGLAWIVQHFFQLGSVPSTFFGFLAFAVLLLIAAGITGYVNRGTLPNPFAGAKVDTDKTSTNA